MVEIEVAAGASTVTIGPGATHDLGARIAARWSASRRVFVISDDRVWAAQGGQLTAHLRGQGREVCVTMVPSGEESKSLATAGQLYTWLADQHAERGEPVIACGGGVVGDLAGFVAATYLRGVPLIQVPTTLLAMVDSSVGGKTGLNLPSGKNLVGSFYQPSIVVVDPSLLATLPARELRSGWAEVIKYGLLDRSVPDLALPPLWPLLHEEGAALRARQEPLCTEVIAHCIRIKAAVVTLDEREAGLRRILNLGHTIGHAIEVAAGYGQYLHGEAVALGLRGAARLSVRLGLYEPALLDQLERTLDAFDLPCATTELSVDALLERISRDKKVRSGQVHWILPNGPGTVTVQHAVPEADVRATLATLGAV